MGRLRLAAVCVPALALMASAFSFGQTSAGDWQKSYPVLGKASLVLSTGDASLDVRSCGECRAVHVRVEWRDRKPEDFNVNEFQSGDHVNFELKEKAHMGIHFSMGSFREPHVTVDSPTSADMEVRTADGGLKVSGVQGSVEAHTSDGSVDIEDVSGAVRLTANDGSIKVHNVTGTLESRSSDGHAALDGKLTALQVHTSDGNLEVTLEDGSQLSTASHIEASDGRVTVRLPHTMAVDLDVHTSDGKINCSLPVMVEGYNSAHDSGHSLRGHLNGGGIPLSIPHQRRECDDRRSVARERRVRVTMECGYGGITGLILHVLGIDLYPVWGVSS